MTDTATPATDAQATEAAAAAHAAHVQVVKPEHTGARVTVLVQPEEKYLSLPRPKTALVARNGQLLTPARHNWPNDDLLVRKVASSG